MNLNFPSVGPATLPVHENIIVIGGGPSVTKAKDTISLYIKEKKPLVISSNRMIDSLGINSQYIVFLDYKFFDKNDPNIVNTNLVIGPKIFNVKKKKVKRLYRSYLKRGNKIFKIEYDRQRKKHINKIEMSRTGYISHFLGSAGFASIILSSMMSPKEVFLSGFDGVNRLGVLKKHYEKSTWKEDPEKVILQRNMMVITIKHLRGAGVNIKTSKYDKLWGADFKKFRIKTR